MAGKGQTKRKDKDRVVLKVGECQRANGTYHFCWTDKAGKRHFVYAKTLEELREKEAQIEYDKHDGIKTEARYVTVNELFDLWCQLKRGLKNNTFENYKYMYNTFVRPNFGKHRISILKKSDATIGALWQESTKPTNRGRQLGNAMRAEKTAMLILRNGSTIFTAPTTVPMTLGRSG